MKVIFSMLARGKHIQLHNTRDLFSNLVSSEWERYIHKSDSAQLLFNKFIRRRVCKAELTFFSSSVIIISACVTQKTTAEMKKHVTRTPEKKTFIRSVSLLLLLLAYEKWECQIGNK